MTTNLTEGPLLEEALRLNGIGSLLLFPVEEYRDRKAKVLEQMAGAGLDALLVSNASNISWLTGYQTVMPSSGIVLFLRSDGETVCIAPDLELPCIALLSVVDRTISPSWTTAGTTWSAVRDLLGERSTTGHSRVGVERSRFDSYAGAALDIDSYVQIDRLDRLDLIDCSLLISSIRRQKSDLEILSMREAGRLTAIGLQAAIDYAEPGMTQNEIVAECYRATIAAGSECMSIDPMIVTGEQGGYMPFVPFTNQVVPAGAAVYLESSASARRYSAPLMRSFTMGPPSKQVRALADLALDILDTVIRELRGGRTGDDIASAVDPLLRGVPEGIHYPGTLGYSCGLGMQPTWTDAPFYLSRNSDEQVLAGMTLHLPICLWSPSQRIGVGFSETVLVGRDSVELITPGSNRELQTK